MTLVGQRNEISDVFLRFPIRLGIAELVYFRYSFRNGLFIYSSYTVFSVFSAIMEYSV